MQTHRHGHLKSRETSPHTSFLFGFALYPDKNRILRVFPAAKIPPLPGSLRRVPRINYHNAGGRLYPVHFSRRPMCTTDRMIPPTDGNCASRLHPTIFYPSPPSPSPPTVLSPPPLPLPSSHPPPPILTHRIVLRGDSLGDRLGL